MAIIDDSPSSASGAAPAPSPGLRYLWNRQLPHYPDTAPRTRYLAITVLATVALYYELYIPGAVATAIIADLHMSFTFFVFVSVVGNLVGAFASLFAGLADRWGRANLVVGGLLITAVIIGAGLPSASSPAAYMTLFAVLSFVEGIVLVATPALIRDFSPQVGRGAAMGFWTLGPVLGSLVVTEVSSNTLGSHPDWRFQFYLCGIAGAVVFLVALFGLRELSPAIRDQLMVSMRDRVLVEARAAGIDPEQALEGHWRQMLRFDILGSAFAISVFLLLYYMLVGFAVVYFATVYGYSPAEANGLANWYWIANAVTLVVVGVLSDRLRVRKPFMVLGTVISLVGSVLFALSATNHQSYGTLVTYFVLCASGGGMAYVAWMASFTETVERRNPAATATGLAVWGWLLRLVVTASLAILTLAVPATSILVDKGTALQEIVAKHGPAVAVLSSIDPATSQSLAVNPNDAGALATALSEVARQQGADSSEQQRVASALTSGAQSDQSLVIKYATVLKTAEADIPPADLAYLAANGAQVKQAASDSPGQWQTWWWVCIAGQLVFLPFIFVMAGRWNPRKAREDEAEHEALVQREMAALDVG